MGKSGAAADVLLLSQQSRLAPGDDRFFIERAVRINSSEGLSQAGNLLEVWNPATDRLEIHRAQIIRNGKVLDLLAGGQKFTVLRRETNLEAAMIDGQLTATLQLEDLRVGDVVDFAVTLSRREPALAERSQGVSAVAHAGTIGRLFVTTSWPKDAPYRTWKTDDLPELKRFTEGDRALVSLDQTGAVSPEPPTGASTFDRLFGVLAVSNFQDWRDVSAVSSPLYAKAETLEVDSPLRAEIAKIAATTADPKARALLALKLVEDQVRYLYVGLDAGGYTPAAADVTWTRRFGDCKGKTALLLAILHGLKIEADPALVNTAMGEGLDRELPLMGMFDHVMVRAVIGGRTYWLDGTRQGDEDLDILPTPNLHWALPVRAGGAPLEPLQSKSPVLPLMDTTLKVDARAGADRPAKVQKTLTVRGDAALGFVLALKTASGVDADRSLRNLLTDGEGWITPSKIDYAYDGKNMEFKVTLLGEGVPPFTSSGHAAAGGDWLLNDSYIGSSSELKRRSDYHRNAPYSVAYPRFNRSSVEVILPGDGKAFSVMNDGAVNQTAGGVVYSRTTALEGARFVMIASSRAVASQFPAIDGATVETERRTLSEYPISLRYAPVAQLASTAGAKTPVGEIATTSTDPAERAAAAFFSKDYAAAETGFTAVLEIRQTAKLYYDRAAARLALGKIALAKADLMAALKLDPKQALSYFALGRIALSGRDFAEAATRFGQAQAAATAKSPIPTLIATAYETAGRYQDSSPYWEASAEGAATQEKRAQLLNSACWSRARSGQNLAKALDDCNQSLNALPNAANTLDSRGLVQLRLNADQSALADYTAALAKRPAVATSLFGRGIAESRLNQKTKAEEDVKAAVSLDPKIAATFLAWGLHP